MEQKWGQNGAKMEPKWSLNQTITYQPLKTLYENPGIEKYEPEQRYQNGNRGFCTESGTELKNQYRTNTNFLPINL